jgi:hypothetical protein
VQVVATLVSEIVLCVKEVNQKTRAAAYGLLVDLGQAMHEADPPSLPSLDTHMEGLDLKGKRAGSSRLPPVQAPLQCSIYRCFSLSSGGIHEKFPSHGLKGMQRQQQQPA